MMGVPNQIPGQTRLGSSTPTNGGGNSPPGLSTRGGTPASPNGGQPSMSVTQRSPGLGTNPLVRTDAGGGYGAGGSYGNPGGGYGNSGGGGGGGGGGYSSPYNSGVGVGSPGQAGNAYAQGGNTYSNQQYPFASHEGLVETASNVLPDIYRQPFLSGLSAAGTTASYAGAALPGASQFQQGLYSENLNPFETNMLNSSAYLGSLGLEQAMGQISGEYALDPYNSGKNKSYYDAANQFAAQMMQTGSQMGLDRMSLATQNLPNVFNFPNQAAQYGQQSAAGLYNAYDQALYGDLKLAHNMWSNYPIQGSTYVQPAAPQGK